MEIDYRALLVKYMTLVVRMEGITFLNDADLEDFSKEEIEELHIISTEI